MTTLAPLFRIAWRYSRTGLVAMTAVGFIFALAQPAGYHAAAPTQEDRIAFARQTEALAVQMSYMLPLPKKLETLGGYLQWRIFGSLPILFCFWAVVSGTGAARGDEDRGLVEQWIGAGGSRAAYLFARLGAFALTSFIAVSFTCLVLGGAAVAIGDTLPTGALTAQAVALWLVTLASFGLALLVSQLAGNRRSAAGVAGVALLVLFLLNSFSRTNEALQTVRWLSPFAYYDANDPLVPGGSASLPATAVLLMVAFAATALAALGFTRRDLGESLLRSRPRAVAAVREPSRNPLLRTPALAAVYEQRWGLVFWMAGISLLATFFVSLAAQVVDMMLSTQGLRPMIEVMMRAGASPHEAFLGYAWFGLLQLLLALFVITQVARWTNEDAEGRLEMVLAAPVPRWRVVIERALALAVLLGGIAAFSTLALNAAALGRGLTLSGAGLARAALMLVPFGLAFGAIGAVFTGWAPRAAVIVLSVAAVGGYFLQQLGSLFRWPEWVIGLSFFKLYGAPLAQGIDWPGLWALLGITTLGFALAIYTMQRREVGR